MHLPTDQPQFDEDSGRPRPRIKRADIQARKLGIGIGAVVGAFWLFLLAQASPSVRKFLLLWLAGCVAFYWCFSRLLVYSYKRDKQKANDKDDQPVQ